MGRTRAPSAPPGTADMRMSSTTWTRTMATLLLVATVTLVRPPDVSTQARPAAQASSAGAARRGEAWFYQRCSLCHMGRTVKDDVYQPMGPLLNGVLKGASPDREKAIRAQIQRGSPRMPGFEYTFPPAELEELIAYMKTL